MHLPFITQGLYAERNLHIKATLAALDRSYQTKAFLFTLIYFMVDSVNVRMYRLHFRKCPKGN